MKKLILAAFVSITLLASTNASAYGQAYLQSCRYEYNADYGQFGYVGTYRHISGNIYRYFFPGSQYTYCPQSIDF